MLPLYTNTKLGDVQELILPPVDLSGPDVPILDFVYAYAQRVSGSNDMLDILVSSDCGQNWTNVFSRQGPVLASVITPQPNSWIPSAADWRQESVMLTNYNLTEVIVKFVGTNGNGNNLYIDDINLRQPNITGIGAKKANTFSTVVFPNPAEGSAVISITSPSAAQAFISVTNMMGQVITSGRINVLEGETSFNVDLSNTAAGIYHVSVTAGNEVTTTKLTVTH
jgi:hypothetical protein